MIILNIKMQTFYSMILSTVQVNFQFGHIKFIHHITNTVIDITDQIKKIVLMFINHKQKLGIGYILVRDSMPGTQD